MFELAALVVIAVLALWLAAREADWRLRDPRRRRDRDGGGGTDGGWGDGDGGGDGGGGD